jgi:hypothetical protein
VTDSWSQCSRQRAPSMSVTPRKETPSQRIAVESFQGFTSTRCSCETCELVRIISRLFSITCVSAPRQPRLLILMILRDDYRLDALIDTHDFCGNRRTKSHCNEPPRSVCEWGFKKLLSVVERAQIESPSSGSWSCGSHPTRFSVGLGVSGFAGFQAPCPFPITYPGVGPEMSMSALPFHEKAGRCQQLLWLGKFISDVFLCPDIR